MSRSEGLARSAGSSVDGFRIPMRSSDDAEAGGAEADGVAAEADGRDGCEEHAARTRARRANATAAPGGGRLTAAPGGGRLTVARPTLPPRMLSASRPGDDAPQRRVAEGVHPQPS